MAKQNKKLVATSILSVALCGALLASSSFAWFTDKVVNEDNSIASGELDIRVVGSDLFKQENGKYNFESSSVDLETSNNAFISEENWEPGQANAKSIMITNTGSLNTKLQIELVGEDAGLVDSLWFTLKRTDIKEAWGLSENYKEEIAEKVTFEELTKILEDKEFELIPYDHKGLGEWATQIGAGYYMIGDDANNHMVTNYLTNENTAQFLLEYGMNKEAGNEYQNKSFSADLNIVAAQAVGEKDGFGEDQYDENATYPESETVNNALAGLTNTEKVEVVVDMATDATVSEDNITDFGANSGKQIVSTNDITINGNGNVLDLNGSFIFGQAGCDKVTIKNVTIVNAEMVTTAPLVMAPDATTIILENVTFVNSDFRTYFVTGGASTEVIIKDCTFASNYNYNSDKGIVTSGAKSVTVENTTLNGTLINYAK